MIATPFHNQFGLQSIVGVAKPVYRAFQLLRGAGDRLAAASANSTVGGRLRSWNARTMRERERTTCFCRSNRMALSP